ncbi:uncharacterized protein RJT20DRAFT_130729 [Scheffersomyces xylosifermentans]|uniref:uncharacterized protein n=1 Tax=Scheffersomyces xylosifermentans TaxID=1304137 RepID=UPI00315D8B06
MTDNTEKYPTDIQKLFAPKPPLLHFPPSDYAAESRRTAHIAPLSSWKQKLSEYKKELAEIDEKAGPPQISKHQQQIKRSIEKKQQYKESFARQLREWNDPELLVKNEREFMKDPFKTVFISRLDYKLTELDISKYFSKFGLIESVRIIRDSTTGKSRGYGFIVFARDWDAKACVSELARTGVKLPDTTRTILVDIERGRIVSNWKPRRLGGGLGGRHYTKSDNRLLVNASAAASARNINIANNPHINQAQESRHKSNFHSRDSPSSSYTRDRNSNSTSSYVPHAAQPSQNDSRESARSFVPPTISTYNGLPALYRPVAAIEKEKQPERSVRDKYAKYASVSKDGGNQDGGRSIRSIRQG